MSEEAIKKEVQQVYGSIAKSNKTGCSCNRVCASTDSKPIKEYSKTLGYSENESSIANDSDSIANLGLGCGNPTAIASLKEGETVIDLGSGGGFDSFLASKKVGKNGKVIGVDMTQDMIDLANKNAKKGSYTNVEFRLGEIESLPVEDEIADVIISNCVVNLSTDKEKVFKEVARALKKGGRIAISDIVEYKTMPDEMKNDLTLYSGCIAGAINIDKLKQIIESTGFKDVIIDVKKESKDYIANWAPGSKSEEYVASADIFAVKI